MSDMSMKRDLRAFSKFRQRRKKFSLSVTSKLQLHIPVIMFNTLRFKYFVLFQTHTLFDKSFTVLQLITHLSNG